MLTRNFTIVDIETTGGHGLSGRVIEIGIIRVEHGEVVQKYKSLVNPQCSLPEFITELTGISEKMLNKAPAFEEIVEDIFPLFEDSIFVAHNSSFDYGFLKSEFRRAGFMFNMDSLCTVRLSRALYPEHKKHNLGALIERFNFKCKNRHRAYDDAKVLWDFLKLVYKNFPNDQIEKTVDMTIKKISPSKQKKLSKALVSEVTYVSELF